MTAPADSIVITGLGAYGAAGRNCRELWENCRQGRAFPRMEEFSGLHLPVYRAADPGLSREDARRVHGAGRAAALALVAAREAWDDARVAQGQFDPARVGLILGTSRGPADVVDASLSRKIKRPSEA